jgi:hypothetical protein
MPFVDWTNLGNPAMVQELQLQRRQLYVLVDYEAFVSLILIDAGLPMECV